MWMALLTFKNWHKLARNGHDACWYLCRYGGQGDFDRVVQWPMSRVYNGMDTISSMLKREFSDK